MYRGMASPRTVVKVDRASRAVRREYPPAAICRSQALTSSAVMEARVRFPNAGRMCTSIWYR
jgi:hypothetical protein